MKAFMCQRQLNGKSCDGMKDNYKEILNVNIAVENLLVHLVAFIRSFLKDIIMLYGPS